MAFISKEDLAIGRARANRICPITIGLSMIGFAVYIVISLWPIAWPWGWALVGFIALLGLGVIGNAGQPPSRGRSFWDGTPGDLDLNPMNDPRLQD